MKRIVGACLMAFVLATAFSPASANAASSDATKKKIAKFFFKLKKIPNGGAPPTPTSKVQKYTLKLVKLDPKKANKYYKTATRKYAATIVNTEGNKLGTKVIKSVEKSGLSSGQIKSVVKQVTKTEKGLPPNATATPLPPYGA